MGLVTIACAVFLEYEHQILGGVTENYVKIALDNLAAILSILSSIFDLYLVFCRCNILLNIRVSILKFKQNLKNLG